MPIKNTLLSIALLGLSANLSVASAAGGISSGNQSWQARASAQALSLREETDILFMREEEKLARDVYRFLYELWSMPVFDNISGSEQRHFDSMGVLIDSYGLTDPVAVDSAGAFTNPELASLYITLTTRGQASRMKALYVGAFIEETDIRDIQEALDHARHTDIIQTYENLLRGSRNHLRAFVRAIENRGSVYQAQVLTQDEVDAIVDSPVERGR